ncbi:permease-like cell division protein FtsX [Desulfurispora thermophila]|uniref:permease-like cell division protein FtsX n=1 Tax=Desulfurispora thermophila TaxID=265470 RepID=UPI0003625883|nr:permease-like cell division protein FtsX [Desulfurispora thermophila]
MSLFNTIVYYWREAFTSIGRNSWLSLACVGTVAVSLMVLGCSVLLALNAAALAADLEAAVEIRVFLKDDLAPDELRRWQKEIESWPEVSLVEYVSKSQALEEMKKKFADRREILQGLEENNPLPAMLRVKTHRADQVAGVAGRLASFSGVEEVNYGRGLVEKLVQVVRWVRLFGLGLVAALAAAAVFLVSTNIRLSVFARRREIGIMVFLGATNWFVRMPFLLEGMLLGLAGAVIAAGAVYFGYRQLLAALQTALPFVQLVADWRLIYQILGGMVVAGVLLGSLGSVISMRRFLKV